MDRNKSLNIVDNGIHKELKLNFSMASITRSFFTFRENAFKGSSHGEAPAIENLVFPNHVMLENSTRYSARIPMAS